MDHLSGLDAAFLYLETPETPMHVGSLHVYELPPGYAGSFVDDVRAHIARRMHLAPVFRRRLLAMPLEMANPVWVLDDEPDLEHHIRSATLPEPGSREQLDELVGRLHSKPLDRSRPLWEFHIVEGLRTPADAPRGTRHVGFYAKIHHAALDGASAAVLAAAMLDTTPIAREVRAAERIEAAPGTPGAAELAAAALRHLRGQVRDIGRALPDIARTAAQVLKPAPGASRAAPRLAPPARWFAPRTALNANITARRAFASVSIALEEAKHVAKAHSVSLNEVVLAICAGALRAHLDAAHGLPAEPLLAAVPVSLRKAGDTQMNTQASMMRIGLATDVADPLARLRAIHAASSKAKALTSSLKAVLPTDFPSLGAPWLIGGLTALYGRSRLAERLPPVANVVISNVPGPPLLLYLAGAKMLSYYPVSIPIHGVALNITVESYNGSLDFGLIACPQALPGLAGLARELQAAHRELLATLQGGAPATKPRGSARTRKPAAESQAPAARKSPAKTAPATKRVAKKASAGRSAAKKALTEKAATKAASARSKAAPAKPAAQRASRKSTNRDRTPTG